MSDSIVIPLLILVISQNFYLIARVEKLRQHFLDHLKYLHNVNVNNSRSLRKVRRRE